MERATRISEAWHVDEEAHILDFAWWDDYTLVAYAESAAVNLLDAGDRDILDHEMRKRGLSL